ncbi:MAG: TldD/PmbA family protein [Lachnospiraceae bacterium]|nr:TldD/PmbA family protein [Lachnospiraceae bacterium]
MNGLRDTAGLIDGILKEQDIRKYTYTLSRSEKQELNLENGDFKLMRTVFNNSAYLRVFMNDRMGSVNGNDISREGLEQLAKDAVSAAESATEDPCHDIAPDQGSDVFRQGVTEPDIDRFLERIKEFLDVVKNEYPKINLMATIGAFDRWTWISRNSNGTEFEAFAGQYSFSLEFSASEGDRTTGIDYLGFSTADLDTPFIDMVDIRRRLENVQNSLDPQTLDGKFEGCVILTPATASDLIMTTIYNYASEGVVLDGTSQWLDKVGEQVASEKLTVSFKPYDERIIMGERGTANGFRAEEVTLIDKGVLNTLWLSLYGSKKTGRPLVKYTGSDLVIEGGDQTLEELIASVDKGIIMGGFSGGQPGANGEFSGVAKNSFLIENGRISGAITETMVSGNLGEAFKNIRGITKEQRCNGSTVVPYIAIDGIVISGR